MSHTIVIANQKGGVGKTTTSVNLSAALGLAEQSTLLVDLDPQANSSSSLGVRVSDDEPCIYEFLMDTASFDDIWRKTDFPYLSIIPSHIRLVGAEIELVGFEDRERVLHKRLDAIRDRFDFIIIDCPPSLGLLTLNGLTSADSFLVPMQAEYFALEGLTQLLQTVRTVQKRLNTSLKMEGVVLTMFDPRLNLANQIKEELRKFFPAHMFDTIIRRNVRLAEAPSFGMPVMNFAAGSQGAKDYLALASELMTRKRKREKK